MEIKWWPGTINQVRTDCTRMQQPTLHTRAFFRHMRRAPSSPSFALASNNAARRLPRPTLHFVLAFASLISACGGSGSNSEGALVVNEERAMLEGAQLSYDLAPGTYTADVTSIYTGVAVSWVGGGGAGCMASGELTAYRSTCALPLGGQLLLSNPTVFRIGIAESVAIRITRN